MGVQWMMSESTATTAANCIGSTQHVAGAEQPQKPAQPPSGDRGGDGDSGSQPPGYGDYHPVQTLDSSPPVVNSAWDPDLEAMIGELDALTAYMGSSIRYLPEDTEGGEEEVGEGGGERISPPPVIPIPVLDAAGAEVEGSCSQSELEVSGRDIKDMDIGPDRGVASTQCDHFVQQPAQLCSSYQHYQDHLQQHSAIAGTNVPTESLFPLPSPSSSTPSSSSLNLEALRNCGQTLSQTLQHAGAGPNWESQSPYDWTPEDVLDWVYDVAGRYGIDKSVRGENFQNVTGYQLCQMTVQDFSKLETHAEIFQREFEKIKSLSLHVCASQLTPVSPRLLYTTCPVPTPSSSTSSTPLASPDMPAETFSYEIQHQYQRQQQPQPCMDAAVRRRPGRPHKAKSPEDPSTSALPKIPKPRGRKPGQRSKGHHLWEFIRDLLLNPTYCPSVIQWEDRAQGIFRIVDSKAVSQLWGIQKKNRNMTYEKLSRAIRFCQREEVGYFSKLVEKDHPKKLCFKFGPKTSGWQY